jgi:chromosome partitioning protein
VAITETRYANLHLITASPDLADLQGKLESKFKINKLRKLLVELSADYERIYIDTPPALNFYTFSALVAAERLLIPYDCDSFSRQALLNVMAEVEELRQDHNAALQVEGVVVNQFAGRTALHQTLVDQLRGEGLPVLPVYLSNSIKMRESHEAAVPWCTWRRATAGAGVCRVAGCAGAGGVREMWASGDLVARLGGQV